MSIEMILMAAIGLLVGIGVGFFIGRGPVAREAEQKAEIESELWQTKREGEEYRHQVNNHFEKTAELLGQLTNSYKEMTERYKEVYEHLAHGAQTLASREVGKKLTASTIDQLIYEANEDIHVAEKSAKLPSRQTTGGEQPKPPHPTAQKRAAKKGATAEEEGKGEPFPENGHRSDKGQTAGKKRGEEENDAPQRKPRSSENSADASPTKDGERKGATGSPDQKKGRDASKPEAGET